MLTPANLTSNHQKIVQELITHSLENKTSHCLSQVGIEGFEGMSLLCPLLPGKAMKLSYSTQNSVSKI